MFDAKLSLCFLGLALQHRLASGPLFTSENAPTRLNFLPQNQVEFMQSSSIFAATRTASTVTISPTMASESPEQAPAQGQAEGQAADSKPVSEKVPPKQKPQYTCPDGKDRFLCADCGGAKNVVASKESGEANAECIGLADGMWEGCSCYEDPDEDLFGSDSEESDNHVYALERDFAKIRAAGKKPTDGVPP